MGLHSTLCPLISHSVIRKKIRMALSGCGATHNEDTLNFQARAVRHFCILFCGQHFSRKIPDNINWSKIFPPLEKNPFLTWAETRLSLKWRHWSRSTKPKWHHTLLMVNLGISPGLKSKERVSLDVLGNKRILNGSHIVTLCSDLRIKMSRFFFKRPWVIESVVISMTMTNYTCKPSLRTH